LRLRPSESIARRRGRQRRRASVSRRRARSPVVHPELPFGGGESPVCQSFVLNNSAGQFEATGHSPFATVRASARSRPDANVVTRSKVSGFMVGSGALAAPCLFLDGHGRALTTMVYVEAKNLPAHIGIIMDGNGRWAQLRGGERVDGHREGSKAVRRIV